MLSARNTRLPHPLAPQEVQDLEQETLVVVWRKLGHFQGRSILETWIYPFCGFILMRALRSRARRGARESDGAGVEPLDDPAPLERLDLAVVHDAIERLDDEESAVIRLKHFEDQTFEELAARLAISPNTAKTRYYRALRRLKLLLTGPGREAER